MAATNIAAARVAAPPFEGLCRPLAMRTHRDDHYCHHHNNTNVPLHRTSWPCSKFSTRIEGNAHVYDHRHGLARARAQVQGGDGEPNLPSRADKSAALMSAFEKAAAYRKSLGKGKPSPTAADPPASLGKGNPSPILADSDDNEKNQKPSGAVLLDVLSPDFKSFRSKQELEMTSALAAAAGAKAQSASKASSGQEDSSQGLEVEIITRDGVIKRKATSPGEIFSKIKGLKRTGGNSVDFMGLDFSEKKSASKGAKPAGLAVRLEAPPPGALPEVEIITRDGKAQQSNNDGLYKPKVVTWGRPVDISRTPL